MERIEINVQTGEPRVIQLTPAEIAQAQQSLLQEQQRLKEMAPALRKSAYQNEADPLFFKWQAGEATEAEWKAKRDEIKARHPD